VLQERGRYGAPHKNSGSKGNVLEEGGGVKKRRVSTCNLKRGGPNGLKKPPKRGESFLLHLKRMAQKRGRRDIKEGEGNSTVCLVDGR